METLLTALRAAAEPTRLRLLALCGMGELTVSELVQILGQSQPRVSRHLKLLCEARLLDRFREGSWAYYRLTEEGDMAEFARDLLDRLPEEDATLTLDRERLHQVRASRAEAAKAWFSANAAKWDEIRSLYADEEEIISHIRPLLPEEGVQDYLDVGTGTGHFLIALSSVARRCVGVDLTHEMLQLARANIDRADLRNATLRQGDMYQLPFPAGSFDLITFHQVLHYAEDPVQAVAEAARLLRPGGQLVIIDLLPHDMEQLRESHAHRRLGFEDEQVQGWCDHAGLDHSGLEEVPGSPLTIGIWHACRPEGALPASATLSDPAGEERRAVSP